VTGSVLVVDDSAIDRRLAGALLQKRGLEVVHAVDGLDALRRIEDRRPDVVVTDLQMPGMTGLELVAAIRARYPSVPVVLMTAHGSEEIALVALRAGASSYVPKRKLAADLADTVTSILELSKEASGRISTVDPLEVEVVKLELGSTLDGVADVVGQLEAQLVQLGLVDETGVLQIAVALREAIVNAIIHGNLEVSSALLEEGGSLFQDAVAERQRTAPFADRKVQIVARYVADQVTYVITDEGPGFDPSCLPDPTDVANLERPSGRGLMLISMFMNEVSFNARGNQITMTKRRG